MKTDLLATKAINQTRGGNIFLYLGLRYYLDNICARKDIWAKEVAPHLVATQTNSTYLKTENFKKKSNNTNHIYRDMFHPAPNELLAEIALIDECSHYEEFSPQDYVYSYRTTKSEDINGVFQYYYNGYQNRLQDISQCCLHKQPETLLITDIVKFYPNLDSEHAIASWKTTCQHTKIPSKSIEVGLKIIDNHFKTSSEHSNKRSILTGPLFSHIIANISLSHIDKKMNKITDGKYWRYVDDIVLAGSIKDVTEWRKTLSELLSKINLKLHKPDSDKDFQVRNCDWTSCYTTQEESASYPWMKLIDKIKKYVYYNSNKEDKLFDFFKKEEIRFPLLRYSSATDEDKYSKRVLDNIKKYGRWFARKFTKLELADIENSLLNAREFYISKTYEILSKNINGLPPLQQKKLLSQLKFYTGRVLILGKKNDLTNIAEGLKTFEETYVLKKIMQSIALNDITELTSLGSVAAQASAQLFSAYDTEVKCTAKPSTIVNQGVAVFYAYGIKVNSPFQYNDEICQFARADNILALMDSNDSFIKEISSLHGKESSRHQQTMKTAFSIDENIKIEVIEKISKYKYI